LAVEARRIIRASPDRVFAHIGRIESLPRYGAPLWMAAEPVEKRRSAVVVTLTGYFAGLPVESVLRVSLRSPHTLEFKQVRGTLRALSGQCSLTAVEDGTEVRYRLEADPGIAMITDAAARQFLVQFVERMLDRVRLAAERKAPVRRAARPDAAVPEGLEAAEEDEADSVPEQPAAAISAAESPPPRAETTPAPASGPRSGPPGAPPGTSARQPSRPSAPQRPEPARSGRRRRRRRRRGRPPTSPGQSAVPPG
jgi:Polyketide cyclase / dehydrase and lipid transport